MTAPARSFAVVPAAGESLRMGRPKLLLQIGGQPLLARVLEAWKKSRVHATLVVVRPDDHDLAGLAESCGAIVVRPPLPPTDMRASVAFGIGEVRRLFSPQSHDNWLVAPADLPGLSTAVIDRLIAEYSQHPDEALVPLIAGRRRHPVLLPWHWTPRLRHLEPNEGLDALLSGGATRSIDCSDLISDAEQLDDVDTMEDYERLSHSED